ncbi:MAG: CcmD family protein [Dehalococcoidales bacterium]|jgi:CcmD family protein|nr:CcmD family protein [Dehalococcoidales bacterium]MDD3265073.1 CcmD family protein [Dehalococcoidales bacterium]MDD4322950.1 CcmD family protein [Dehalococcoidales bacterium]MDD4794600.1 CcmD family protein [Dehalococcoidales bacterium]MDD5122549.1 CcmD family protein [Dehalococcoidales bacterium]
MENAGYLLAAFIIIWAALLAYIFILARKQAGIRREIELIRENLAEVDQK